MALALNNPQVMKSLIFLAIGLILPQLFYQQYGFGIK